MRSHCVTVCGGRGMWWLAVVSAWNPWLGWVAACFSLLFHAPSHTGIGRGGGGEEGGGGEGKREEGREEEKEEEEEMKVEGEREYDGCTFVLLITAIWSQF